MVIRVFIASSSGSLAVSVFIARSVLTVCPAGLHIHLQNYETSWSDKSLMKYSLCREGVCVCLAFSWKHNDCKHWWVT